MTREAIPRKGRVKPMTPGIPHGARVRAHVAAAVISIGLFGLAWRAWALQVDDNDHYRELAEKQHGSTVQMSAPRGEILDAAGRALAVSADADSIWINQREIRDVTATADKLAPILGSAPGIADGRVQPLGPAALEGKLAGDRRFVWLARHVKPEIAQAVRAAKLPGVEVARESHRWYPGGSIGAPIVGRADIDGNGLDGIELAMNEALVGTRGAGRAVRDARGRRMFADGIEQASPGATVKLTIDRTIQAIAEDALVEAVQANSATSGVAVVLDVATGRVLAMATAPTSDPNRAGAGARNRVVSDAYEAGSVMKIFTVAAALEAGATTPDTEWDLQNGQMFMPGRRTPIRDVHVDKYLTTAGIIKRSSNVGAAKIALRLGSEKLYAALLRFGFGARTNLELPGEAAGMIRPAKKWRDVELATIAYGYGITVTPLQIAAALAAIGDDGIYHAPRIIDDIVDAEGRSMYRSEVETRRVVSAKTAADMRAMLASVFERGRNHGTGWNLAVPGFKCGGKTGTAHKYDPASRQYAKDHYLSSFAGLAPIDHPRLAIVVLVDDPSGGDYFGGTVAGPVFTRIASDTLRYLGVRGESLVCPPAPARVDPMAILPAKTCVDPAPARPAISVGESQSDTRPPAEP